MVIKKKNLVYFSILFTTVLVSYGYFSLQRARYSSVTSFTECVTAGFPVLKTYPETCKMPGKVFVNERQVVKHEEATSTQNIPLLPDFKNTSYFFDGQKVSFTNGTSEIAMRNGTTSLTVLEPVFTVDVNADTATDTVLLLKSNSAHDTVYYVSLALSLVNGSVGTNILTLGKDITSPVFVFKDGILSLEYKDSKNVLNKKFFVFKDSLLQEIRGH